MNCTTAGRRLIWPASRSAGWIVRAAAVGRQGSRRPRLLTTDRERGGFGEGAVARPFLGPIPGPGGPVRPTVVRAGGARPPFAVVR